MARRRRTRAGLRLRAGPRRRPTRGRGPYRRSTAWGTAPLPGRRISAGPARGRKSITPTARTAPTPGARARPANAAPSREHPFSSRLPWFVLNGGSGPLELVREKPHALRQPVNLVARRCDGGVVGLVLRAVWRA